MLQEIQVRGGVKKLPHPSGGVEFFWNNPFRENETRKTEQKHREKHVNVVECFQLMENRSWGRTTFGGYSARRTRRSSMQVLCRSTKKGWRRV